MNDLISIIVPIYNMEKYLDKCINSIINQTYTNLEILLIDDGSLDNSRKICNKYKKIDNRIKVFHKKNGGLSDARNYGISKATGKYIGFIDSDDYIENNMYEELYNNIIKYNADISVSSFNIVYEDNNLDKVYYEELFNEIKVLNSKEAFDLLFKISTFGNFAWNKLYKKELFNNIKYPIDRKMEDIGTTYKLIDISNIIVYSPLKLYNYLQRTGSIMRTKDRKFVNDIITLSYERFLYYEEKYGYLEDNHLDMAKMILYYCVYVDDLLNDIVKRIRFFKIIHRLNYKEIIKLIILDINKKLFIKLFTKNDII